VEDEIVSDADIQKRIVDLVLSWTILIVLFPIFLFLGLLVYITSGKPIIFKQTRLGENGKPFTFLKFRTMVNGSNPRIHKNYFKELVENGKKGGAALYKLENDPRVTPIGRWLRKFSLDELPQFINVLKGDMSIVGPRPPIPYELEFYKPEHLERLRVKPGITGLWQVSGRTRLPFDEMVKLDVKYARKKSLAMDLFILIKTIPVVLKREGAA
jgi:lipopolysaccharide/colanic/teichoic acid biosynthesis glycosyltransferase